MTPATSPPSPPSLPEGVPELGPVIAAHPDRLLFATVSGAHLYGFPSADSDVDVRGVHLLPLREVLGLGQPRETHIRAWEHDGVELDLVTHDLAKFARLLLRPNGYVLEQLLSPLVAHTTPAHAALAGLAPRLLTRHHARHYRGFARTQWRLFEKTGELKPLLYTFRALLTGVHLMRAREVVAHLPSLLGSAGAAGPAAPAYLPELIEAKAAAEHGGLGPGAGPPPERLAADVAALHAVLDDAEAATSLPERPSAREELDDLVVTQRLATYER
jgi:predicted nucleotidyltransferase